MTTSQPGENRKPLDAKEELLRRLKFHYGTRIPEFVQSCARHPRFGEKKEPYPSKAE